MYRQTDTQLTTTIHKNICITTQPCKYTHYTKPNHSVYRYKSNSSTLDKSFAYGKELLSGSVTRRSMDETLKGYTGSYALHALAGFVFEGLVLFTNPHLSYFDSQSHGYARVRLDQGEFRSTFVAVPILTLESLDVVREKKVDLV